MLAEAYTIRFANLDTGGLPLHMARRVFTSREHMRRHTHDFFEFLLVEHGVLRHWVDGREYVHSEHDIFFLGPENSHYFRAVSTHGPTGTINVAMPRKVFLDAFHFLGCSMDVVKQGCQIRNIEDCYWRSITEQVRSILEFHPQSPAGDVRSRALLAGLVSLLFLPSPRQSWATGMPAWLVQACERMKKREERLQGIKRFVELSGKTQEHCTRVMKKCTGQTPTQYINRLKTADAARLLETTRKQVLDVAFEAGFCNSSHFTNTFRRFYGKSPGRFRRERGRVFNV